ncbi:nucleotide exchange factor GrpE [Thermophagus sp. OGC60D27]|uniref:nucleotide exchange factor GrpE n=1 Tax=Thermophagus sp. OGC60D27 TaxID=3458415 RepID=UPI0040378CAA
MSKKKVTEETKKQDEKTNTKTHKEHPNPEKEKKEAQTAQNDDLNKDIQAKDQPEEEKQEKCEEAIQDAIDEKVLLQKQLEELNDKHLRLIAEYDNFRKRTLKEKMELSKTAGESILLGLLPVIDDFDRALAHLDSASDLKAVKEGIDLIYNKFKNFLKQQGVTEIETKEQEFDSETHEAITKIPAPSEELKGKIVDCIQKGYKLNDKVIRYPKVVVGE